MSSVKLKTFIWKDLGMDMTVQVWDYLKNNRAEFYEPCLFLDGDRWSWVIPTAGSWYHLLTAVLA